MTANTANTAEKRAVRVIGIPAGLDDDAVEELVNGPLRDSSYYLAAVMPYEPGALAFYRLRAEKPEKLPKPPKPEPLDEAAAIVVLEANRRMTAPKLQALLAAKGIKRGRQWVYTRRAERGY
jgi:hypothetical protein